jgi:hypothetical protein
MNCKMLITCFYLLLLARPNVLFSENPEAKRLKIDLSGYNQMIILKKDYAYSNNWEKFVPPNGNLKIAFKLVKNVKLDYLSEIVYFIDTNGEITILGDLSTDKGFRNAFGEQFSIRKDLLVNSNYMKNELVGFSTDTLKYPFFIRGIAKTTNTGEFFKTEVLTRIKILEDNLTIAEYFSMY